MALKKQARNKIVDLQQSSSVNKSTGASGRKGSLKHAAFDKDIEKKSPSMAIADDTKSIGKVKDAKSLPRTPKFK